MADRTSTSTEISLPAKPSRLVLFAHVRRWLAVALMALGAVDMVRWQVHHYQYHGHCSFDPAPIFYLAGAMGLALRVFWARYLSICFAVAMLSLRFFWGPDTVGWFAVGLPFIALLSGRSMWELFEGRAGRLNHWAADLDRRVARLRVLFVAQSIVLALLYAMGQRLSPGVVPLVVAAGLAIVGLVFQRTWAVLAIAPVIGLELCLAVRSIGAPIPVDDHLAWCFTAVLLVACAASLAVVSPLLWSFWRKLRGQG